MLAPSIASKLDFQAQKLHSIKDPYDVAKMLERGSIANEIQGKCMFKFLENEDVQRSDNGFDVGFVREINGGFECSADLRDALARSFL